jgi:hypothetical protein
MVSGQERSAELPASDDGPVAEVPAAAWPRGRRPGTAPRRHLILACALVTAVTLLVVHPFLAAPPLGHDHPVHLFKAWHFWTEMLGRGRLRGWSNFWGFGFPSGELTPLGPEAWVALFRIATLGQLSWLRTYGLAYAGALLFSTLAALAFARRQFGMAAGVLAAILNLLDPGDWAEGGWVWHTTYGVWPITLAMGFTLLALAKLIDGMSGGQRRDFVVAGVWMGASLLVHQMPLVVYPITIPLLGLDHRLRTGALSRATVLRLLLASAIGFGLAAFYEIPMMARSALTLDLGVLGVSREALGKQLAEGALFGHVWPPFLCLGFMGGVLALGARGRLRAFVPLTVAVFVVLSTNVLIEDWHLERVLPGLVKIEARRFLLVAKLFFFPLVAHAVVSISRATFGSPGGGLARKRQAVAVVILAAVAAPLAWPVARELYRTQVSKDIQGPEDTRFWGDLSGLLDWSAHAREATTERYRVAYALPMHDHLSTIAPVFDGGPIYKVGYTPAQQFNRFPMSGEPWLLEALSVKYVVADHPLAGPDFTLERTFGVLLVYRFNRFRPEPELLRGPGRARLLELGPETIRVAVEGVDTTSRLRLSVASFPRWRATLDGVEVPISTVALHDGEYPIVMEIAVPHGGEVELRYVRRAADWLGLSLTIITLLCLGGALSFGRASRAAPALLRARGWVRASVERARTRWAAVRWPRRLAGGKVRRMALAAVALLFAAAWWWTAEVPLPADSLFRRSGSIALELAGAPCRRDGFGAWQCGVNRIEAGVNSGIYGAHVCMNAPAAGRLTVTASVAGAPRFVAGRYDTTGGDGRIEVDVSGRPIGRLVTRDPDQGLQFFQFETGDAAGRAADLRISLEGAPLHCFDLSLIP